MNFAWEFNKVFICLVFGLMPSFARATFSLEQCRESINSAAVSEEEAGLLDQAITLIRETQELCGKSAKFGFQLCTLSIKSAPGIAWRALMYDPSFDGLREEMLKPMARHIRDIRRTDLTEEAKMKAYQQFIVFWPEFILKLKVSIPKLVLKSANNGLFSFFRSGANDAAINYQRDAIILFMKTVISSYQRLGTQQDLDFMDRIQQSFSSAAAAIGPELSKEIGLDDLLNAFSDSPTEVRHQEHAGPMI